MQFRFAGARGPCAVSILFVTAACDSEAPFEGEVETLGETLFFDEALSFNRSQSCAGCHDPERAFADGRPDHSGRAGAASLGADGVSLGDRNAPTVTYAALIPPFEFGQRVRHHKQDQHRVYEGPMGGLFHDGRASTLADQAAGPPLNPIEMGMADQAFVVNRLREDAFYVEAFPALMGVDLFGPVDAAYAAMTQAIARFEETERFTPFDAKYDRFLRGEADLSFKELTGKSLFFSQFTNCAICHQLEGNGDPVNKFRETFTGYEFHNLGVPANAELRARNGLTHTDEGLAAVTGRPEDRGKFRTPTLRNVAVTGPYMHNGVFRDLKTVVEFYDEVINPDVRAFNPETSAPWADPEVAETVATDLLKGGRPLTDLEVESLVCFLRTLTDKRYEDRIEAGSISCSD